MAKVKNADLLRLEEINAEVKDLASKADALKREAKAIEAKAAEDLKSTDKDTAKRGEFLLSWIEKNGSVSWKSEFVKVAGADAAKKLSDDAPKSKALQITRLKPAA